MIVDASALERATVLEGDVAVVGAGPAGIVVALELARAGVDVLLVESGAVKPSAESQRLADAAQWDPERHLALADATRRQIGGATVIWGGRCVPYDPIDFEPRDLHGTNWPVSYAEIASFFARACDWFVCGRPVFDASCVSHLPETIVPGLPNDEVLSSNLERWSLPTNFGKVYESELRASPRVRTVTSLTCVEFVCTDGSSRVDRLEARRLDGEPVRVRARKYVLACGGLGTTRLLLASDRDRPGGLGNHSQHLGRWYMGHISGRIARVQFSAPPDQTIYGHERDVDGVYVRRRFSFSPEALRRHRLPNIVAFLANPELADPSHRSGVLSFAYLVLASPFGRRVLSEPIRKSLIRRAEPGALPSHLRNIVRDVGPTAAFALTFAYKRFVAYRRAPGFFVQSDANRYLMHYHGEQLPNAESSVSLTNERDALGMRKLRIDLRYTAADVDAVMRAHRLLDDHLRRHGAGYLDYVVDDVEASVWRQAGDGCHQLGTTRMAAAAADGVVDRNLAVHGFDDLYVASSSAFVTSSQANPAFTTVAFALRLADHLRAQLA